LAAVTLLFCSCGTKTENPEGQETPVYEDKANPEIVQITLPYSQSDSLNPFFATGVENSAVAFLYCQPLFEVKSDYSFEPVLAESYELKDSNITVALKPAFFSDGSTVAARDVVYSFNLAKQSPAFSTRLASVQSAIAVGNSVSFVFASPDAFGMNLLSFPVVKSGTAGSPDEVPTGSGIFMMSGDEVMTLNPYSEVTSEINTVYLYNVKQLQYIVNELQIGNFNYLFEDLSEGQYKSIVAENKTVTLNNLVFLGINSNDTLLSSSALRTAIYYAVDKGNVSAQAYQGYSKAAVTPFNPDFYMLDGLSLPSVNGDREKSLSILKKLGYNMFNSSGVRTNGSQPLSMSLIVNSDNAFRTAAAYKIADGLRELGFGIKVEAIDSESYRQRIAAGNFQLYLGEIKLTENLDLSVFKDSFAGSGIDKSIKFFEYFSLFRQNAVGITELIDSFYDDMPFVPVCYRAGIAAYSKAYTPDFSYAPFNIYGNIENWEAAKPEQE
jgi:peptide/nickel transport system substrate-binding protein